MVTALTNPELYASLAALVAALTALAKLFKLQASQDAVHDTLKVVQSNTDGQLRGLQADVRSLTAKQATPTELEARESSPSVPQPVA